VHIREADFAARPAQTSFKTAFSAGALPLISSASPERAGHSTRVLHFGINTCPDEQACIPSAWFWRKESAVS